MTRFPKRESTGRYEEDREPDSHPCPTHLGLLESSSQAVASKNFHAVPDASRVNTI